LPYADLDTGRIFYEEIGAGEPIIFLHNAFSRGIIAFSAQMSAFQTQYRCIFPDLRGHGRTISDNLNWTIPQLADDIIELMNAIEIKKAHIIGYSMGGGVALYAAAKYPERISSLVTIGAASCVTEGIKSNADNCELHILKNEEDKRFIELLKKNHYDAHDGDWRAFVKTSVNNWRKYPDLASEELGRIACPSMFISGANDNSIKEEHILKLAETVPNSISRVIEGCGHGPHLIGEKPEVMNKIILEFLNGTKK